MSLTKTESTEIRVLREAKQKAWRDYAAANTDQDFISARAALVRFYDAMAEMDPGIREAVLKN
jgi:hypothetical protein